MGSVIRKMNKNHYETSWQRHKEIEAQIRKEKAAMGSESKLLLLGAAEAGKTTIIKQMRILHNEGFSESEINYQKLVIHSNIIQSMASIIQAMGLLGIGFHDPSLESLAGFVVGNASEHNDVHFTEEVQHGMIRLWNDKGIRETFERRSEYQLNDSVEYFFNQLERVGTENFVPTQDDILHARVKTTGIVEIKLKIKELNVRVLDVGGQRSERKKWIQCFDDVSGIIFVVSLSEYNQKLREDGTTNRVQESLRLFAHICNHDLFIKTAVMLFLNKKDLFEQKINKCPLTVAFPEYQGKQNYAECVAFLRKKFRDVSTNPLKKIYSHETCATDTQQVKFVLDASMDVILQKNIEYILIIGNSAPAGAICLSANANAKYLAFLTQQNNTSPLLPPKWIIHQAQSPANLMDFFPFEGQPQIPVDISMPSYGLGWMQGVYRAYRNVQHGGAYFGYLSSLYVYPDLNLAIFMSSTNDAFLAPDKTSVLSLAIFDVIMQKQTWLTPSILCTLPPFPPGNGTALRTCTFTVGSKYLALAGTYNHPLFGTAQVSSEFSGSNQMKVRFQWGYGTGYLCQNANDGPNTYRLNVDARSPFAVMFHSIPLLRGSISITFNLDQKTRLPVSFTNWQIEPRVPDAATFYHSSFNACSTTNPCQNQGTCIPQGQFDYMCKCSMWFTGPKCQYGPNRDCTDLHKYYGKNSSGLYWIHPTNGPPLQVYCDMTTSNRGWTIIQRRIDGSVSFNQSWAVYQKAFGSLTGNYWMGLNNIWMLTSMQNTNYTIRVDLWDCNNLHAYEEYDNFWISGSSDKYRFHVTPNSARGNANDGFTFGFSYFTQQNIQFSTPDQDNDNSPNENCAQQYSSGWWFNACYAANLNGVYHPSCIYSGVRNGIEWIPWKFSAYSMKKVEIKIKRM